MPLMLVSENEKLLLKKIRNNKAYLSSVFVAMQKESTVCNFEEKRFFLDLALIISRIDCQG